VEVGGGYRYWGSGRNNVLVDYVSIKDWNIYNVTINLL
jgi:hypothetical protein